MTIDVNQAIQELLYEQEAVVVPGLGGFTSKAAPATVDYVQDIVQPPSSKLDFNPNLVINDGVLVQYLQKANLTTYQEAGETVERYVQGVKDTLERREIFEIPKVGRLYKDYEHKVRFMSEGTNFNAGAFGLPTVEFQPLAKEKGRPMPTPAPAAPAEPVVATATGVAETAPTAEFLEPAPPASTLQKTLPWLVLLAAFLLAFTLYRVFSGPADPVADLPDSERVNVSPNEPAAREQEEQDAASAPSEDEPSETAATEPATTPPPVPQEEAPKPPPAPVKSEGYLIVHSFGVKGNADKFVRRLTDDGYTPETKQEGSLYRVGVRFEYASTQDFERVRQELAAKYEAGPKTEKELEEMER